VEWRAETTSLSMWAGRCEQEVEPLIGGYILSLHYKHSVSEARAATQSVLPLHQSKRKLKEHHYMHAMHHALCDPALFFIVTSY